MKFVNSFFKKNQNFIKIYEKPMLISMQYLTMTDKVLLYTLFSYIQYNDCILQHKNKKKISREYISQKLNISIRTVDRSISNLCKNEIIKKSREGKVTYFIMNPYIAHKGKYVDVKYVDIFKNTKWAKNF